MTSLSQTAMTQLPLRSEQSLLDPGQEFSRKKTKENAREYTSFLMSNFVKIMLESAKRSDITVEEDIMGISFLGDALGEALVESGAGEFIEQDLLSEMLEMQGLREKKPNGTLNAFLAQKAFANGQQGGGSHASS